MNPFKLIKRFFQSKFFAYGLFWSWNLLFVLLLVWLELQTQCFSGLIKDTFIGLVPLDLTLFGLLALFTPIISIVIAVKRFSGQPQKLVQLFFGVEGPIILFCLLRISILRELVPGTAQLLFLAIIGIAFYFNKLVRRTENTSHFFHASNYIGHMSLLFIGSFIALLLSFYALPLAWGIIYSLIELFKAISIHTIVQIGFFGGLAFLFAFYTATLFVFTPVSLPYLYGKAFVQVFKSTVIRYGKLKALAFLSLFLMLNIAFYLSVNWTQPQQKAFELLEKSPITLEEKAELVKQETKIRKGLVNAYLASYRYISDEASNNHIEEIYMDMLHFPKASAETIQEAYNIFCKPFLYQGNMRADRQKAREAYETFFDAPIEKKEQAAVMSALKATWDREGIEASLLNINEEKVRLKKQEINIQQHKGWAEVELYECYNNQTFRNEEIFYYFSLPEYAVITGLWLSDDREVKKYPYRVSPKGAAQAVYKAEVRRRVDPSLLEKVGPTQYRLRAFPIPGKRNNRNRVRIDGSSPEMVAQDFHLWISYQTLIKQNKVEFPTLLERRNVYWNEDSKLTINGQAIERKGQQWYPSVYELENASFFTPLQTQLNDSTIIEINQHQLDFSGNTSGGKIALLIDQSYSMKKYKRELVQQLEAITTEFSNAEIDIFFDQSKETTELKQLCQQLGNDQFSFWGSEDAFQLLLRYRSAMAKTSYNAIIVATDEGSYELIEDSKEPLSLNAPLYLLHVGNKLPAAYPDHLLELLIQTQGKSVTNVQSIKKALRFNTLKKKHTNWISYTAPFLFSQANQSNLPMENELNAISAHQFMMANRLETGTENNRLSLLDQFHQFAMEHHFVSPFSSMIVLVNERQRKALDLAEQKEDRFDREVENGKANLSLPANPFAVSGTPEPEEWLLIGIVSLFVIFTLLKGRLF